ncbi:enoyl-ACP reductase FabI [Alterisphingorhabdus coralli]|uniref:Enoyl-[acyl-carrier-protein] reductase [NADH] n=1 Tax=Alterisphingorhabdus coralli TaxID=3071408 RepID=A0AA97F859_9SPHN|nr:enoyl-ACP reductase FabI [Parasphingorhabdus sp. SCSIO 66989]WOE74290.1 enoyl-ACP reductase FabI [Parasphingorhabdus sp. SCSIO 66989]
MLPLQGKKGIILGIANDQSLAWGCAKAFHDQGAELALSYFNGKAKPHVAPLAEKVEAPIFLPLDVTDQEQWDTFFAAIEQQWGEIDFALHSVVFAPKEDLHGRVVDCSSQGFLQAMDISCHSFIRMAKACEPLMTRGGSILAMSYYGAQRVIENYNMMGPVKSALEASVRQMADELGESHIRVNALSAGPIETRAASGLSGFDKLMEQAAAKAPLHQLTTIDDVGAVAAFLVSDAARHITGQIQFVDCGYNIIG